MSGEVFYWDTNLFIAWMADEQRTNGDMDGVRDVLLRVKRGAVRLVTSSLTLAEALPSKAPAGMYNLLEDVLRRRNVDVVSPDRKIMKLARDLRDYYVANPLAGGKTLSTPDAIHVATAIIMHVNEMHTFDDGKKRKNIGLLELNGNIAGHKLVICRPTFEQPSLDLKVVKNDQKPKEDDKLSSPEKPAQGKAN